MSFGSIRFLIAALGRAVASCSIFPFQLRPSAAPCPSVPDSRSRRLPKARGDARMLNFPFPRKHRPLASTRSMSPLLFARLWLMVFLHYFVWGTWYVTMGTYLTKTLEFPGAQVGLAYGSTAVGAMVSPFLAGIIADRFFATQRMLGCLHLIGAGLLLWISTITEFPLFYATLIAYTISYMAGHGLTNTLTLHHSKNPAREFPLVMMMGSVGWICAGLVVSALELEDSASMFRLAALSALVMGLYSLTLPHTPPKGKGARVSLRTMLGLDALELMKDRSFAVFIVCSFLVCIPLSFYFSWMNVFMNELKIDHAAAKMTIGQVSDVAFLMLMPLLLPRLGVKGILLLGMGAWALRFSLFSAFDAQRDALWMLYLGIAVHGMCYDFIFVMGRMYVDDRATADIRGAAQGFHAFVTLGAGMFVGSWLSGVVGERYAVGSGSDLVHDWRWIWLAPAVLATVLGLLFAIVFRDRPQARESPPL
ncbi:MAG: MFS transporter [Planctomycetales bacterium]